MLSFRLRPLSTHSGVVSCPVEDLVEEIPKEPDLLPVEVNCSEPTLLLIKSESCRVGEHFVDTFHRFVVLNGGLPKLLELCENFDEADYLMQLMKRKDTGEIEPIYVPTSETCEKYKID